MLKIKYKNKEWNVVFAINYLKLDSNAYAQSVVTCVIHGPGGSFCDATVRHPKDAQNMSKANRTAFERAARKLSAFLYKKGGPRPHKIKYLLMASYFNALLQYNDPEKWAKVQEEKRKRELAKQARKEINDFLDTVGNDCDDKELPI